MLELGLAAPIIALILVALTDIGSMAYDSMALQSAARAGAQYAMKYPGDPTGATQAVLNSTTLDPQKLTVTSTNFCECSDGSSVACSGVCADGKPKRIYVSVAVQQAYQLMLPYPGIQDPTSLTGQSVFRVK